MSDVLKPIDIVYNVHNAKVQAENMCHEADRLELRASNYRTRAAERVAEGFEEANRYLVATWQSGEYSDVELLRAQLELSSADPLMTHQEDDPTAEELVDRFARLRLGEYVLGLGQPYFDDRFATGVIFFQPTKISSIVPAIYRDATGERVTSEFRYSPMATISISIMHCDREKGGAGGGALFEFDSQDLRFGLIGHEAIAKAISESDFTTNASGKAVKQPFAKMSREKLAGLRKQIDDLYGLGMDEIDTEALDGAVEEAQDHIR